MDLKRVMDRLRPRENCASDHSDYAKMVASWRRTGGDAVVGDPPSLALCEATWAAIEAEPPPSPVATPLTAEDIERLLLGLGVTRGQINAAKNGRGQPL